MKSNFFSSRRTPVSARRPSGSARSARTIRKRPRGWPNGPEAGRMAGVERARVANDLLDACGPPAATANLETDGAAQRGDRASDSSAGSVPERGLSRSATARGSAGGRGWPAPAASRPRVRPPPRRARARRVRRARARLWRPWFSSYSGHHGPLCGFRRAVAPSRGAGANRAVGRGHAAEPRIGTVSRPRGTALPDARVPS